MSHVKILIFFASIVVVCYAGSDSMNCIVPKDAEHWTTPTSEKDCTLAWEGYKKICNLTFSEVGLPYNQTFYYNQCNAIRINKEKSIRAVLTCCAHKERSKITGYNCDELFTTKPTTTDKSVSNFIRKRAVNRS